MVGRFEFLRISSKIHCLLHVEPVGNPSPMGMLKYTSSGTSKTTQMLGHRGSLTSLQDDRSQNGPWLRKMGEGRRWRDDLHLCGPSWPSWPSSCQHDTSLRTLCPPFWGQNGFRGNACVNTCAPKNTCGDNSVNTLYGWIWGFRVPIRHPLITCFMDPANIMVWNISFSKTSLETCQNTPEMLG